MARTTKTPTTETPATDPTLTEEPAVTETPTTTPTTETPTESAPTGPSFKIDDLTVTTDVELAVATYGAASTGQKTKIRNGITTAMQAAVMSADLPTATAWVAVQKAIDEAGSKKAAPVTDYTQTLADRIIGLRYAAHRLTMGDLTPDAFPADQVDRDRLDAILTAFANQHDPDAVSDDQAAIGNKIAASKITRTVVRGSVEAHIETAFAELPVGTELTVAQIRTRSGAASDGAIAARVWPSAKKDGSARESSLDFTALGVVPCEIDGVRGMRKVTDPA
jgi:hypothetical protein